MSRKGNLPALLKAIQKNPKMSPSTKAFASERVIAKAERKGIRLIHATSKRGQPQISIGQQVSQPVIGALGWYFILSIGSTVMSLNPLTSISFSIFQFGMLASDFEEAQQGHKVLQNTLGALVTFAIGWALNDLWAWGGALVILSVISLVVIAKIKAYFEPLF